MSDKVKLPKVLVNALDEFKSTYEEGFEYMVTSVVVDIEDKNSSSKHGVIIKEFARCSQDNFKTLLNALVYGYEVEETPEDKVREYYLGYEREQHWTACNHIKSVLELLGITIKGVNA